jgi:translation initiation factor IF-1
VVLSRFEGKMKKENIIVEGEILELLPNTMFRISLVDGREVLAIPSGKMRRGFMRFMPGNRVKVEMTPYDDKRGRVVGKVGKK